ncbi:Hop family adhesin BabA [Helicobacter pylori]|uniref:Outer membrane protein family protein n=1 Tax=Helicobacter pylori Hp P-2 TaxID=992073 RepID=J0EMY4_HELPX|nr:Hop family adhesin BabA [Helicobacter pylori]EJC00294.1 outer membrane protein family protein [Helicobacter pylori Hp P-2]
MKKHILSLTLGSLLVSTLSAEDDGFYMSAGYQIGEAAQMVKNTKGIQDLSDRYESLNNLLTRYSTLNTLIKLSSDPSAINGVRNDLGASAKNLIGDKANSPAYQAVLLAINAAVGFWNIVGYVTQCGGNANGTESTSSTTIFNNEPGYRSTSITCSLNGHTPGYYGPMSIENFKKLNEAYQILQTALKKGLPALKENNGTVKVEYTYTCSGEGNNNCDALEHDRNGGSKTTTQTIDGKSVTTTISSKVVNGGTATNKGYTEITNKLDGVPDSAQALLAQASTLINTINEACPYFHAPTSQAGGPKWEWPSNKLCGAFSQEIGAIQKMITDAQELVNQTSVINSNERSAQVGANKPFNPFTDASFAQSMLANAQAQAKMLNLAEQVGQTINPERLSGTFKNFVTGFLATCNNPSTAGTGGTQGSAPGTVTTQTFASGCAYVEQTLTNLNNDIAHFGTRAQQIQQAADIADTLVNFKSRYNELGNTYNSITTALSSIPNAQSLQNAVSKKNNPYSPQGIETNYYLNQNTYNQIQTINQELGRNPFRKVGIVSSQTNNGAMNGIGIQVGYKQFFGQKRRWGARYYGFFDYNHAFIKSSFFNSASDVWTYGFGADALYNFINDKATNFLGKNNKLSVGLFGGIALAGTSWLNSEYVNLATVNNVYNAKLNVANFQFLFNMGVRMNLARSKKKGSDHVAQHGIELGLKIPTINTNYYSFMGAELKYRRLYSVYLNYVFAY